MTLLCLFTHEQSPMVSLLQVSCVGFTPAHVQIILAYTLHPGDTSPVHQLSVVSVLQWLEEEQSSRVWTAD